MSSGANLFIYFGLALGALLLASCVHTLPSKVVYKCNAFCLINGSEPVEYGKRWSVESYCCKCSNGLTYEWSDDKPGVKSYEQQKQQSYGGGGGRSDYEY